MVIVAFNTQELRTICEQSDVAVAKLGDDVAAMLRDRLADIRSADTIYDLPVGNPRVDVEYLRVDLGDKAEMRWVPIGKSTEDAETGRIDWGRVNRIKLMGIDGSRR